MTRGDAPGLQVKQNVGNLPGSAYTAWGLHEGQVYDRLVLPLPGLGSISEDMPKAEECNS